jgi:hypothetical protein
MENLICELEKLKTKYSELEEKTSELASTVRRGQTYTFDKIAKRVF